MSVRMKKSVLHPGVARRIRWHVAHTKLNETAYAAAIGSKRSQVNSWRMGYTRPSLDAGLAMCRRYGLTLEFIYRGDDKGLPAHLFEAWREFALANPPSPPNPLE